MVMVSLSLREDYWDTFELSDTDLEFLYNYLLETETPLTSHELVGLLVGERIRLEKENLEAQRTSGGELYFPHDKYAVGQTLVFPALGWRKGDVSGVRSGNNPDLGDFEVIQVNFGGSEQREYAAGLEGHTLNAPPQIAADDQLLQPEYVLQNYLDDLIDFLEDSIQEHSDFVQIAGRWFPPRIVSGYQCRSSQPGRGSAGHGRGWPSQYICSD